MNKKIQSKLITFSLILALIGVASSFCSFLFVPSAQADMISDCQDRNMPMVSGNSEAGAPMMVCCVNKNNNSSYDISDINLKISKLSVCQNVLAENNIANNSQDYKIYLASNNSPPGEKLSTVIKKE